jgi:hypothetical protein
LSDVGVCRAVEGRQRSIKEVIAVVLALNLVSRCVAGSNHSHGAIGDPSSVILGEPTALTERF